MYSATRTINTSATLRVNASIRNGDETNPFYDCEVTSAFVSSGWTDHMTKANQLMLQPDTADFNLRMLTLTAPKIIVCAESGNTLSNTSLPPSTDIVTLSGANLDVTRLDNTGTDTQVTTEFRTNFAALPAIGTATYTDYNRIYLLATSSLVEYRLTPAMSSIGATEPGVIHANVGGAAMFDPDTDLYLLDADGGNIVTDGNGYDVWFARTDIITNVLWSAEVVIGACELRNTVVDEVEIDILRGSATSFADISIRLVI